MEKRSLKLILTILAIELLTVPIVISFFKFIEPKKVAAVFAASLFVTTGILIIYLIRKYKDYFSYATYWAVNIQLFLFSLPMLLARIFFWEKEFEDIKIFFFSGPDFHKISEKVYLALIIAAFIDIIRVVRARNRG